MLKDPGSRRVANGEARDFSFDVRQSLESDRVVSRLGV